jgi:hypothetical protein
MVTQQDYQILNAQIFARLDVSVKQAQQLLVQLIVPQGFSVLRALGVK